MVSCVRFYTLAALAALAALLLVAPIEGRQLSSNSTSYLKPNNSSIIIGSKKSSSSSSSSSKKSSSKKSSSGKKKSSSSSSSSKKSSSGKKKSSSSSSNDKKKSNSSSSSSSNSKKSSSGKKKSSSSSNDKKKSSSSSGKKKSSSNKKKKSSSSSSSSSKIIDIYDFLKAVVLNRWCMAVPAEQSFACYFDEELASYSISLRVDNEDGVGTDWMNYCCEPFYDYIDLDELGESAGCTETDVFGCFFDIEDRRRLQPELKFDFVFIPYESGGDMALGQCCEIEYPNSAPETA